MSDLPNLDLDLLMPIDPALYTAPGDPGHAPRILILYGSLRERSFSRFVAEAQITSQRLIFFFSRAGVGAVTPKRRFTASSSLASTFL